MIFGFPLIALVNERVEIEMNSKYINEMVDKFLAWKLPEDFNPDCGIIFTRTHPDGKTPYEPTGTNLFDAMQAIEMISHITSGIEPIEWRKCEDYTGPALPVCVIRNKDRNEYTFGGYCILGEPEMRWITKTPVFGGAYEYIALP